MIATMNDIFWWTGAVSWFVGVGLFVIVLLGASVEIVIFRSRQASERRKIEKRLNELFGETGAAPEHRLTGNGPYQEGKSQAAKR